MNRLGIHTGCGGEVVLIVRPKRGFRFCFECGKRGVEVALVQEQPPEKTTEKVTLSRKVRMFQYVSRLKPGHVIGPEEEQSIDDCAIWIQAALLHYGLDLRQDHAAGGWRVIRRLEP